MITINSLLQKAVRSAAKYNPEIQVAPACILWPDRDRQWEAIIPRLQNELPELLTLGEYNPEKRTGPAIWLRCVIARKADDVELPGDRTPIIYLPGISRQDLRAVESCPEYLKPIASLQYLGVIWSQINAKDWTILAFLKSDQGGLGLDVAQDNDSKSAMLLALYRLLDEDIGLLKGKRLDKDYFNTLLMGGDPVRDLLQWLDQGDAFRASRGENEWRAFVEVSKSQLAFSPESDGILIGAAKLAIHEGPWLSVWERFCEAPKRYPHIPEQIQRCKMPAVDLFSNTNTHGGWPQWNDEQEVVLRKDLLTLKNLPPHEARKKLIDLEKHQSARRKLVWTELGSSPLALALEYLALLAETTANSLAVGTTEDLVASYCSSGWRADDALLRALASIEKQEDFEAVYIAIRAVYLSWAEESARHFQKEVTQSGYPGGSILNAKLLRRKEGECVIFVDGLRFDVARRFTEKLLKRGLQVEEKVVWAALPSVTPTGKPAVSPVKEKICGQQTNINFEPCVAETGQSLKGGYQLKKLLEANGWQVLDRSSNGEGKGNAWCEFGDIDHEGHDKGAKLTRYIDGILDEIRNRVIQIFAVGWKTVRIVTDHGWLLVPGGLPKIELPSALVDSKWGRCAAIKMGANTDERLYPWYWNPNISFALADGISCFRKGEEYAHGGLSLQECLTLELTISKGTTNTTAISAEIIDVIWKGLRCNVVVDGNCSGVSIDIRKQPGNPSSSVVLSARRLKDNGTASVVVEDEDLKGTDANIVLLNENGELVFQIGTVIGGSNE